MDNNEILSSEEGLKIPLKWEKLTLSIGEIMFFYKDQNLTFQVITSKWDHSISERFIESIFLGIPLQPITCSTRDDASFQVIDGSQRLHAILEFMNLIDCPNKLSRLNNENLYFLKNSHNKKWDEFSFDERLDFKRRKIELNIIGSRLSFGDKNEIYFRLNNRTKDKQ